MPEYKRITSLMDLTKTRKNLRPSLYISPLNLLRQDYKAGIYNYGSLLIC